MLLILIRKFHFFYFSFCTPQLIEFKLQIKSQIKCSTQTNNKPKKLKLKTKFRNKYLLERAVICQIGSTEKKWKANLIQNRKKMKIVFIRENFPNNKQQNRLIKALIQLMINIIIIHIFYFRFFLLISISTSTTKWEDFYAGLWFLWWHHVLVINCKLTHFDFDFAIKIHFPQEIAIFFWKQQHGRWLVLPSCKYMFNFIFNYSTFQVLAHCHSFFWNHQWFQSIKFRYNSWQLYLDHWIIGAG